VRGPILGAALLIASGVALILGGCGSSDTTPAASHREREDFAAVSHVLDQLAVPIDREVRATKVAWPLIANGLPASADTAQRARIRAAALSASRLPLPPLFGEVRAASLTGPAAHLAGLFRSFRGLATHGWQLIGAAAAQTEGGSAAATRFARANIALYIESVYDGHFGLAQIGKQLSAGYAKLGGPSDFGSQLTAAEVSRLALAYSEANDRLHPHVGVRLGS
jgi:hypothetical protein